MGFGCGWQQLHYVGKVNRELGLLHGTSQVCEAVGKQSGNRTSALQKLSQSAKQQRIARPSTAHALCDGWDSPKTPVASPYKYLHLWTSILSRSFLVEKFYSFGQKFGFPCLHEQICSLLQV